MRRECQKLKIVVSVNYTTSNVEWAPTR